MLRFVTAVSLLALPYTMQAVELGSFERITLNLGLEATAIGQVPSGSDRDRGAGSLSADILFELELDNGDVFFLDMESGYGDGLDAHLESLQGLNGDAIGDSDFTLAELWYAHSTGRLYIQAGHVDLTDNFDTNAYANDENNQFLSPSLINSIPATRNLEVGPGFELWFEANEQWSWGLGVVDGGDLDDNGEYLAGSWDSMFHSVFSIVEADFSTDWNGGGSYRVYAWYHSLTETGFDGDDAKNYGLGLSADQSVTDHLGVFTRLSWGNDQLNTVSLHVSAGTQIDGAAWGRDMDRAGLALSYAGLSSELDGDDELLTEAYYGSALNPHLTLTAHLQGISNRAGNAGNDDVIISGIRAAVAF